MQIKKCFRNVGICYRKHIMFRCFSSTKHNAVNALCLLWKTFAILINPDLVYVLYASLLIILLLRFTLLPFIYAIFEKMGQNDKIKKFITDLKTNAKYRKKCFWTMFLICMLSNQLIYLTMMIGTLGKEKIISEFWEILLTFTVIILVGPYSILYLFYKFGKKKN